MLDSFGVVAVFVTLVTEQLFFFSTLPDLFVRFAGLEARCHHTKRPARMHRRRIFITNRANVFLLQPFVNAELTKGVATRRFASIPQQVLANGAFERLL